MLDPRDITLGTRRIAGFVQSQYDSSGRIEGRTPIRNTTNTPTSIRCRGGEGLRKIIIVVAGVIALAATAALALAGVVPDHTHAWHSIQVALNSAVDTVKSGTHAWH